SQLFISRGDDSGTHKKERSIWNALELNPKGKWYREAGQGMGKVLQMSGELSAYTLTDRGTWLAYRENSSLKVCFEGDEKLFNPYGIIAVNPEKYPDLNQKGARALIQWINAPTGQQLIGSYRVKDSQLFTPSARSQTAQSDHK
ncbi:MAG: tungsten ABC transporter substrate-binding protein, partial [Gammaproteobacteria bacterium]